MLAVQRNEIIYRALQDKRSLSMQNLIDLLDVSRETIRRDITAMAQKGLITKVHGGIVLPAVGSEPAYSERSGARMTEKARIAARAAEGLAEGLTLYLDSGTTILQLARLIPVGFNVQVFTNSLVIGEELVKKQIPTYVLGGALRAGELSLSGNIAQEMARAIHVDRAYFGAGAISDKYGVMDYHLEEAALRRVMGHHAKDVIVLADSSKFGKTGVVHVFDWNDVSTWITDDQLDAAVVERLAPYPVQVVCAD